MDRDCRLRARRSASSPNVVNGAAVWLAAAPDFKFDGIKSIKGQKVVTGLMPTTSTSLFIKLLKENGMDAKSDVEMIQVAIGTEPGPFVAKQADIAVMAASPASTRSSRRA